MGVPHCSPAGRQPQQPDQILIMKVLLLLAGLLLCLHLSEGFSYRGNVMRNRNRGGGSGRGYLRNLGGGGRQRMGGMGFGKRAFGFDYGEPIEFYDDMDENGEDISDLFEEQAGEDGGEAEKRASGEAPEQDPEEKRGISSLKGKRAFGMALSSLRSRGRGKRGALSSLRNQGFVKYNI